MSIEIKQLRELTNPKAPVSQQVKEKIYPITHEKAIVDNNGNTLDNKLAAIIEQAADAATAAITPLKNDCIQIKNDTQTLKEDTQAIKTAAETSLNNKIAAADSVYDVSADHSGTPYDTLSEALAAVPSNVQHGGMSIKFIQTTPVKYTVEKTEGLTEQPTGDTEEITSDPSIASGTYEASQLSAFSTLPATLNSSLTYYLAVIETVDEQEVTTYTSWVITYAHTSDNKYIQFRYMGTSTAVADFTNVANWQGVDNEPVAASENLIKSGGVEPYTEYKTLIGENQNRVNCYFKVIKGHTYNITRNRNDWDVSAIGDGYNKLYIAGIDNEDNEYALKEYRKNRTIPETVALEINDDYKFLRLYIRANEGEVINFKIEDTTAIQQYIQQEVLNRNAAITNAQISKVSIESFDNNFSDSIAELLIEDAAIANGKGALTVNENVIEWSYRSAVGHRIFKVTPGDKLLINCISDSETRPINIAFLKRLPEYGQDEKPINPIGDLMSKININKLFIIPPKNLKKVFIVPDDGEYLYINIRSSVAIPTVYKNVNLSDVFETKTAFNPSQYIDYRPYYGEHVFLKNRCYIENTAISSSGQAGAFSNNIFFRCKTDGQIYVYNYNDGTLISNFYLDQYETILPHCNMCFFGNKYDENDEFPVLYVNAYNATGLPKGTLYGYRIIRNENTFTSTLVQTIQIGFTDNSIWTESGDARPYGNFAFDSLNNELWAIAQRDTLSLSRFFRLKMPDFTNTQKVYTLEDIIEYFDTPIIAYPQDDCFIQGKIFIESGFGSAALPGLITIVDVFNKRITSQIRLKDLNLEMEPEIIDFYDNKLFFSGNNGYLRNIIFE